MFKNLNTATKIISLIIIMAIGMGLIGFTGFYFNQKANTDMNKIYENNLLPIKWINSFRVNIRAGEAITLRLILLNNDKAKEQEFTQQFVKLKDENDSIMANYEKVNLDLSERESISQIKEVLNFYRIERQKSLDIASTGQKLDAYEYYKNHALPHLNTMNKLGDELAEYDAKTADVINIQNGLDFVFASKMLTYIPLISMILALGLGWWVAKIISKPLTAVVANVQEISNGNLNVQDVSFDSKDEVGQLTKAVNSMVENLRVLIKNVAQTAEQLAASSEQLTASAEQSAQAATQVASTIAEVASGAEKQSKAIDDTSITIEHMSANVQQAAANSKVVASTTNKTAETAQNGLGAIAKANEQMNNIEKTVNNSANVVAKLGERSKEIGQIVDTISGLAGQTNLLALNAAIEAARAGEQGRGFAVVAEEVRKLAEQSQEAAKQIADLIGEIQLETDRAVVAMTDGTKEVERGTEVVTLAGQSFDNIANLVTEVSEQVKEISTNMQQMATDSQHIVSAVKEIDNISKDALGHTQTVSAATEEQSASMEEIAASSQSLAKMAEELQHEIRKFKI
ncbi:methyl-accepting chemotaxis protein [Sporomusa sp. KB1]|uniref:methyl-accepting chemotaxis protein n=1 Tax=Sporomusa sp. KB1 TaxID=943346 RepID=UPI0011A0DFC8|nr:HAMP domain-containing methyl-accepting chemotaxis protein [Sporomusa sp. KB1]TWH51863.1 methyl-accepting chemotaxis protein [Sporomusa sp. KB1]